MKAVVFYGAIGCKIEDYPIPKPSSGQILIKVKASGICGGEYSMVRHKDDSPALLTGIIPGHEIIGEVLEDTTNIFESATLVAVSPQKGCGCCWYCRHDLPNICINKKPKTALTGGGYAEYCIVEPAQCFPLPSGSNPVEYAMAEPLACCIHGLNRSGLIPGERILIIGAGGGAQLFVQLSRFYGASYIAVADTLQDRLSLAKKMGADEVINTAKENIKLKDDTDGFNVIVVTRGQPEFISHALDLCSWRGRILCYGVAATGTSFPVEPNLIWKKQLSLIGTRAFEGNDFEISLSFLSSGRIRIKELITRTISLEEVPYALENNMGHIKTIITP
jgi:threonine dehydrogenase-like Zn-dependent dehydrogenase